MGQQKCEARAAAGRGGSDAGEVSRPGRGTEVVGCGSCSVGGDKACVLSPASREVFGSVYLLRGNLGTDPALLPLPSRARGDVAAASQRHRFAAGPSHGLHPRAR